MINRSAECCNYRIRVGGRSLPPGLKRLIFCIGPAEKPLGDMNSIHLGSLIRRRMEEKGMSATSLAEMIYCSRTNIYSIFEREDIGILQLIRISKALDYDFLAHVYYGSSNLEVAGENVEPGVMQEDNAGTL